MLFYCLFVGVLADNSDTPVTCGSAIRIAHVYTMPKGDNYLLYDSEGKNRQGTKIFFDSKACHVVQGYFLKRHSVSLFPLPF